MKYLVVVFLLAVACSAPRPAMVLKSDYLKLQDSIEELKQDHAQTLSTLKDSLVMMQDSIEDLLLRPLMTSDQFIKLYKYERLEDYYKRCVKDPLKWKWYKGWSIRVFEQ